MSQLAERFRQGDPRALTEIYDRYRRPMFATALRLLGSYDLAAEAVQQAFVRVWRAADRFDASRELRPWLYAIVRRSAVDVHRQERRFRDLVPLDAVPERQLAGQAGSLEHTWQTWQVRRALARLPEHDRTVLRLAYYRSLTHLEIAAELDLPVGTVKSRLTRALRRLAALLDHLTTHETDPPPGTGRSTAPAPGARPRSARRPPGRAAHLAARGTGRRRDRTGSDRG